MGYSLFLFVQVGSPSNLEPFMCAPTTPGRWALARDDVPIRMAPPLVVGLWPTFMMFKVQLL